MRQSLKTMLFPALILVIGMASAVQAQQNSATVHLKKVSNEDGLTLGNGASLDRISPAYESPFKDLKVSREENRNPVASVHMHLVTTSQALDIEVGVNLEAKARYLFASGAANAEFNRRSSISEESFRLVIIGQSQYGHDELREAKLKPEAAELIKQGKMRDFSECYGTHFVLREHRIARIVLNVSVDRWSNSSLQKLRATLKGRASFPLAGGELKASIQNDLKEAGDRKALNVEISTIGGPGLQGFGEIVKALLSNSNDFQASVGEAVATLLKGFNRSNSGIGSVTVASYKAYGWDPNKLDLWNDLFEEKLQKCAERYYIGRQVERTIRQAAMPNAPPALREKLGACAMKYDAYLIQLALFQKELLKKDKSFIDKEFPREPEIDSETAKALLARFSTLDTRINELSDKLDKVLAANIKYAVHENVPNVGYVKDGHPIGLSLRPGCKRHEWILPGGPYGKRVLAVWHVVTDWNDAKPTGEPFRISNEIKENQVHVYFDAPADKRNCGIRVVWHVLYQE